MQEFLHGEHRERKQYRIVQLPEYLVCHLKRFTKNTWFVEKNPTIVTFPVKNLEKPRRCNRRRRLGDSPLRRCLPKLR